MRTIKTVRLIPIFLLIFISCHSRKQHGEELVNASYEPDWESLSRHETPQWYKDAVLGIYFHWGVYSVPAFGCWGGRNMYQPEGGLSEDWAHVDTKQYKNTYDYVKQVYGTPGTEFGYRDFIHMFKAEKWDPDVWAELFKQAGADFAGPVAIHHDGFAMWDSEIAEYNSLDMGPHRDVVGEMLTAVRKQGLKTVATFHGFAQWDYFNPGRIICPPGVDVNNPEYAGLYGPERDFKGGMWQQEAFSEEFQAEWRDKCLELINMYQPDQIWFEHDFSEVGNITEDYILPVLARYFNQADSLGKEVVVTRKDDDLPLSCSVLNLEEHSADEAQPVVWQTDISLGTNHSWSYSPDAVSRPVNDIIDEIVDRKSMNGITLLDLAPLPDGTLPPTQVEALKKLGEWMAVNKPALYAVRPAPFTEGGPDVSRAGTIRFTEKGNFVFSIDLEEPIAPYIIPHVEPLEDSEIFMLGSSESLPWHLENENLIIEKIPDPLPCDYAWSFKIQYKR